MWLIDRNQIVKDDANNVWFFCKTYKGGRGICYTMYVIAQYYRQFFDLKLFIPIICTGRSNYEKQILLP